MKIVLPFLLTGLLFVSCQSAPAPIAADASSEIYFQRAQAASDVNDYPAALKIYGAFLAERPEANHNDTFTARYEIALLYWKEGRAADAIAAFESIQADYKDLEKSSGAPNWIRILSEKKLQEIRDKQPKPKA